MTGRAAVAGRRAVRRQIAAPPACPIQHPRVLPKASPSACAQAAVKSAQAEVDRSVLPFHRCTPAPRTCSRCCRTFWLICFMRALALMRFSFSRLRGRQQETWEILQQAADRGANTGALMRFSLSRLQGGGSKQEKREVLQQAAERGTHTKALMRFSFSFSRLRGGGRGRKKGSVARPEPQQDAPQTQKRKRVFSSPTQAHTRAPHSHTPETQVIAAVPTRAPIKP